MRDIDHLRKNIVHGHGRGRRFILGFSGNGGLFIVVPKPVHVDGKFFGRKGKRIKAGSM